MNGARPDTSLLRRLLEREIDIAMKEWERSPALWGVSDCGLAVADAIKPALGYDAMKRFRGRYSSRFGFLRCLKLDGFASIDAALVRDGEDFGWRRINAAEGHPGDVGVIAHPQGRTIVVCRGAFWFGRKSYGAGAVPSLAVESAFAVI